jgi:hypothetical protein
VPPLADLLFGRPRQALLNVLLMTAGPILGSAHALIVTVSGYQEPCIQFGQSDAPLPDEPRADASLGTGQSVERKTSRAS